MLDSEGDSPSQQTSIVLQRLSQRYQKLLDDFTPHSVGRWIFAVVLILTFLSRVLLLQGWYVITYGLGIYHLKLLIGFLTPKIDPEFAEDSEDDQMRLPTRQDEEFRPFIRSIPEFKCWYAVVKSTSFAFILSFFEMFDVPAHWPILLVYFLVLTCLTLRKRLQHMIKYRYIPFTFGKPKYRR